MKDEEARLRAKVWAIAEKAGQDLDKCSAALDIGVAMDEEQRADLAAMIEALESRGDTPMAILSDIVHDLAGLRELFFDHDAGFVPRSYGYATR